MADRRLIGFVATILVVTTLVTALMFQIREEEAVRFLAVRTPSDIPGGVPGSPSYSFDILAAKETPDLVIRSYFLFKLVEPVLDKRWNETSGREMDDLIANYPRLRETRQQLEALAEQAGIGSAYSIYEVGEGRKLKVLDFTDAIEAISGRTALLTTYTIYAFEVDQHGNVSIYAGYRDFFFDRNRLIAQIRYSTPSESRCFVGKEAVGVQGCGSVNDIPIGILHFSDLASGQKCHVEVTLNTMYMFGHRGLVRIVRTETGHGPGPTLVDWIGARS